MAKGDVHVVRADSGWRVQIEGSARSRTTHAKQREALNAGREAAIHAGRELLVYGRNGQIRERHMYGKDLPNADG
jgi:Uncharacterized protein conserved in bacteria (DUF2188)